MELWDAYDRDFKKIQGVTLVRGEVIPEGFFHLVCEIIVRHIDGSYLIMQRDKRDGACPRPFFRDKDNQVNVIRHD